MCLKISALTSVITFNHEQSITLLTIKEVFLIHFNIILSNPPYQDSNDAPLYPAFCELGQQLADYYCLIMPGRWLFNAGQTSKQWNHSMLTNNHIQVGYYTANSNQVFRNVSIKGGVTIISYNRYYKIGPIGQFTKYPLVNSILNKVINSDDFISIQTIIYPTGVYSFTSKLLTDYQLTINKLDTNVFDKLPSKLLSTSKQMNSTLVYGRQDNHRVAYYIDSDLLYKADNYEYYKVLLSEANGNGDFGERLSEPIIADKLTANTQTYISIGKFDTLLEAENCVTYLKTNFLRTLLSVLKVTHHTNPNVWKYVPMIDFKADKYTVNQLDNLLYKKYKLTNEEIDFINEQVGDKD